MLCGSSCGESGTARGKVEEAFTRLGNCEGDGICNDSPRPKISGLLLARGVRGTAWSSLLPEWCILSRKVGEGWRVLGAEAGSEKERDLDGVREGESTAEGGGRSIDVSIANPYCRQWPARYRGRIAADIAGGKRCYRVALRCVLIL